MLKAYKYRLYPTEEQKVLLEKHFGCARWVYNWALQQKVEAYQKDKKSLSIYEIQSKLPILKSQEETAWLKEVSAQSLQSSLYNLDKAFTRFFKEKKGFPKFKSKHNNHKSFRVPQGTSVDFDKNLLYILKFKEGIKCKFSRAFEGKIKTTTISKTLTGKYYVSILVDNGKELPKPIEFKESEALGIDLGIKDLVITSDGQKFENPKHFKKYLRRLQIRQRRHSKKQKDSKNREKARVRVAKVNEKISNVRSDNLHKISRKLVCENQATTLCIEDLAISNMLKNKRLARSIQDAGWGMFKEMLKYKCEWYGKNLKVIGRWEASSKTCNCCGHINNGLTLKDREWTCQCGEHHDRDINAAINIKKIAFREQNTESKPKKVLTQKCVKLPEGIGEITPVDQSLEIDVKQE